MDDLKIIYDRISFLRQKGVKMKDMAEKAQVTSSVFSALYTTVLPTYLKNLKEGMDNEEALDNALVWVNNVSKKKLLSTVYVIKEALLSMELPNTEISEGKESSFLHTMHENAQETYKRINHLSGIYLSYSVSSSSPALKIEPYLITPSSQGYWVEVIHNNAYGSTHRGIALMNGCSHLYLLFNEQHPPQLALFHICLKIPMYERPPFMKGVYTCFDYNYNPIARRILFVKYSDSTSQEEFAQIKGELKRFDELNEQEQKYYEYTCRPEDIIRMCTIPSPRMTEEDLVIEKKILELQ